jgi:hypothetical protein
MSRDAGKTEVRWRNRRELLQHQGQRPDVERHLSGLLKHSTWWHPRGESGDYDIQASNVPRELGFGAQLTLIRQKHGGQQENKRRGDTTFLRWRSVARASRG